MTNYTQRSAHVSETARLIRYRLLAIDGEITHSAFVELREAQEELNKMVKRCRNRLGITTAEPAISGTGESETDQPTGGYAPWSPTAKAATARKAPGTKTRRSSAATE